MQVRTPAQYGLAPCTVSDLAGGDAAHNARALEAVLYGEDRGAHRDCLLLVLRWRSSLPARRARPARASHAQPPPSTPAPRAACSRPSEHGGRTRSTTRERRILDEMADASRERVRAAKQSRSEAALEAEARQSPAPPACVSTVPDSISSRK